MSETRTAQLFPTLSPAQFAFAARFASGPVQRFAPHEQVYGVGQRDVPAWLVRKGA